MRGTVDRALSRGDGDHKAPTLWFACTEFPLTASGKMQKFRLRALAAGSLSRLD
jgi:hypothetical protein